MPNNEKREVEKKKVSQKPIAKIGKDRGPILSKYETCKELNTKTVSLAKCKKRLYKTKQNKNSIAEQKTNHGIIIKKHIKTLGNLIINSRI